jgi:flavin-dependent thymidylate synthase
MKVSDNTVELMGFYGGDETHALSAWTSTARELTDEKRGRMGKLLTQLATQGHHTPFEKSYLHFLVTCDTASHIHLIKHRIGVSINAESARYKELTDDKVYLPADWPLEDYSDLAQYIEDGVALYHQKLEKLTPILGRKRAKESARFALPYATKVTMDVGFNFRSFMHFVNLRNKTDAQLEIQRIAQKMMWLVWSTGAFDLSLEAFGHGWPRGMDENQDGMI